MTRKVTVVCILLAALCCQAHAQYTSLHADDPANSSGGWTTVRNWDADRIVSFYVNPGYVPMIEILELPTSTVHWAPLPSMVFIKDMVVDARNGMLYFCGSTSYNTYNWGSDYSGVGLLGWIDLNSVLAGYVNMEYYEILNSGYTVDGVNRLVEYDDGGLSHIVAIGEECYHQGNYTYSKHYFIDCMMNVAASSAAVDVEPFSQYERYRDVLLTDKFVVFVGYDANPSTNSICYRKTNPYSVHDAIFDDIHVFYNGNDARSLTHSTAMLKSDNEIATTYFSINSNGDFVTRVRVLDVAHDANTYSQEFILADKGEPEDIVYIPKDKSLVLMQDFYTNSTSSYNSNFVFIEPYATSSYGTEAEFIQGVLFGDMTVRRSDQYLAGVGAAWFFKSKPVPAWTLTNPDCPSYERMRIKVIDNLDEYRYQNYIAPNINPERGIPYGSSVNSNGWRRNCSN